MWRSENWREEVPALIRVAGPLIVNNLAVIGMQFADTVMAAQSRWQPSQLVAASGFSDLHCVSAS
jgi:Na+-driven multidrug efflux pump